MNVTHLIIKNAAQVNLNGIIFNLRWRNV
ncbi:Citrate Succinate antiporter [Salmonella sp. FORC89]|nr:not available [Salmonella enterica subsp. enterica serovar Typhimurium]UWN38753.1 Citrate Succinate antiporter [Salmonella sp. FORC89]